MLSNHRSVWELISYFISALTTQYSLRSENVKKATTKSDKGRYKSQMVQVVNKPTV